MYLIRVMRVQVGFRVRPCERRVAYQKGASLELAYQIPIECYGRLRAMGRERRKAPRIKADLPIRWEGVMERHDATITSLSTSGCFVLSGGEVGPRELLRLELYLSDEEPPYLWAEVVGTAHEIGFAPPVTSTQPDDQARLAAYIQAIAHV